MPRSRPVDGFSLAYTDHDQPSEVPRPSVVLLHGWPGDSRDYRLVVPLLRDRARVVLPDLRGFGDSDRHRADPDTAYSAAAQAAGVAGLITELGLERPVVAGYDLGGRVARTLATEHPDAVGGLALSPPLPGAGTRVLTERAVAEFWYQHFHRLQLSTALIDGDREEVHRYLRHFWEHWSGPEFVLDEPEFEALVDRYARPGAFTASINWYRAGGGFVASSLAERAPDPADRIAVPVHVLWQQFDPLFPREWSDRLDEFFTDVVLEPLDGVGHFTPLEAPAAFAAMVGSVLDRVPPGPGAPLTG